MDSVESSPPSRRGRRALPLIAAALAVIIVASFLYLRASSTQHAPVAHPSLGPLQVGNFYVVYEFLTPSLGWAVVEYQAPIFWIFSTSDGAKHWHRLYTGVGMPGPIRVQFFDPNHGIVFLLSSDSVLLRTSDGGVHWKSVSLPPQVVWLAFADQTHGWAVAGQFSSSAQRPQLLATVDAGETWTARQWPSDASEFTPQSWYNPHFRADHQGWLGARADVPTVLLSLDDGVFWQPRPIHVGQAGAGPYTTEVNLLPGGGVVAFASDKAGNLSAFVSFDIGQTWASIKPPPSPARLQDLSYVDSSRWWVMGTGTLFKTADAGKSWTRVHVGPLEKNWNYEPAVIIDSNHAWSKMIFALSPRPTYTALAMTSDGGATWTTVNVPNLDVSS